MSEDARDIVPAVYDELRAIARHYMQYERVQHTLQPTALVHEAYLRLAGAGSSAWSDERQFKAIAGRVIRQILVDHARRRDALKRGGDRVRVTLNTAAEGFDLHTVDFIALDDALTELAELNGRQASVVELRFFAGLNTEEIAAELQVSARTVGSEWRFARAWLLARLE